MYSTLKHPVITEHSEPDTEPELSPYDRAQLEMYGNVLAVRLNPFELTFDEQKQAGDLNTFYHNENESSC